MQKVPLPYPSAWVGYNKFAKMIHSPLLGFSPHYHLSHKKREKSCEYVLADISGR